MSIKRWRATQGMRARESQRSARQEVARETDAAQVRLEHLAADRLEDHDQAVLGAAALGLIPPSDTPEIDPR